MASRKTSEFKQEVLRVVQTSGLSRRQISSDFDIGFSTLNSWIKNSKGQVFNPSPGDDLIEENQRLRKENKMLREDREMLKKATKFFAAQKS